MLQIPSLTVRAPAKLILSGEHAVVHGAPALAIAIDRYTSVTAKKIQQPLIRLKSFELGYACSHTLQALKDVKARVHSNYQRFLKGKCSIKEVLSMPFELLQYSITNIIDKANIQLPKGVQIDVGSKIPLGCGMGSSAALIVASLHALLHFVGIDIDPLKFLSISKESENLQHGKSSGLDIFITRYGGACRFQNGDFTSLKTNNDLEMYFINTGSPDNSTGECVSSVSSKFNDSRLIDSFIAVTKAMEQAITSGNDLEFKKSIMANHELLKYLGVVPENIAELISEIEQNGGAGKVCGAGAISGKNAGALLVTGDKNNLENIVNKHGYSLESFKIDNQGCYVV